ncbi:MAG TPA: Rieske (2Fe-2S) protein [Pirellulales bacterium]|jgi:menaquinol-cytochrome c reductase iron-sulfur subunit
MNPPAPNPSQTQPPGATGFASVRTTIVAPPPTRRNFLTAAAAIVIGGIVGLVPLAAGLFALLDPLRRKSDIGNFVRVASLDALPADGIPRRFAVLADRTDAWNFFPHEPIGAVYLRRTTDSKGVDQVEALNSTCPHAGCFVDFNRQSDCYKCPCHNSAFTLTGAIIQPSPSPRPMDTLAVDLRDNKGAKEVWVKFENFYTGIAEKIEKT